jgi:ATP-dependent helicase/nuclease subunit A
VKAADKLARIATFDFTDLPVLEDVFLTGKTAKSPFSAKIGSFPTKATQQTLAAIMPQIEQWMARVEAARDTRLALLAIERCTALHAFGAAFIRTYSGAKQRRGLLDFDDLILRARDLLTDPTVAAWVLYRLDGGIDHILVDEAQDTSPAQWQVIERLAQEFTSGQGARSEVRRTIFVVGDGKQSIYSFQGADPREFDRMQRDFAARLAETDTPLQSRVLAHSFRSAPAILATVDATFEGADESGFAPDQSHIAFFDMLPGRVDLWPVVPKPDKEDPPPWHLPVDIRHESDPAVILAGHIAAHIRALIDARTPLPVRDAPGTFRPITAGDVLILVRRRSALFHEIIRACKAEGLPIAGADRLKVGGELAVRDIAALLSFLATPEDDLSLATALRSPLFGWSEGDLFTLAQGRGPRTLWEVLRERDDRLDGRRRLLARLGAEAEDGIDALLTQALAYEQRAVDSLTGFLVWMETDDLEIKRQMDSAGDRIRVMTVHGAKGLESPVVILPETGAWKSPDAPEIVAHDGIPLWRGKADLMPPLISSAVTAGRAAQMAERDRLLYVAMTRAETWLIVAATGDLGRDGLAWHDRVRRGMEVVGATAQTLPTGPGLRVQTGVWAETVSELTQRDLPSQPPLAPLFQTHAPSLDRPKPLTPSDLGGAKALPGERGLDEIAAKRRGRQIHHLLELLPDLPRADWPEKAALIFAFGPDAAGPKETTLLLAEAQKVLDKPALAPLFSADALAEVPITAPWGDNRLHGVIDRLIVAPDHILAVDFKTNAEVPDRAEDIHPDLL